VESAISVGPPCRGGFRGWPQPLCNVIDNGSCDPQPTAHRVLLAAIRQSFPAERTYFDDQRRLHRSCETSVRAVTSSATSVRDF
jgi:hypothetical protein